ncbi:BtrH N-terminal domain-containing protein [Candidatus Uabimicrobium sp. HlEnr_7]|uniref:BtrH N-terminal domain-containing protein n=1 Tax=Candidatus Uabimicrobium helgolandensis TaxID=3095367 RepID=UPI003556045B
MPILKDYKHFAGIHWETGTLHNYLHYRKFNAPHTNKPYSEAMLLGISGGITMGYFSFAYKEYDPFVALLTRNTFRPWNTIINRLAMVEEIFQTSKNKKATQNLLSTLEEGIPAIVWADSFSLSYNNCEYDESNWAMFPLIVYGYNEKQDKVWIADRAQVPLVVSVQEFEVARARVKKMKFRLAILDIPDEEQFIAAIQKGIWDCIKLYLEKPPKGSRHNFGLLAFKRWADLLTQPNKKMSWAKEFPKGIKMYCGLQSAFNRIALFGQNGKKFDAERVLYSQFLEEASLILNKPDLKEVSKQFRKSAEMWKSLAFSLLPDEVEIFRETRCLLLNKHTLFRKQGQKALLKIQEMDCKLANIKKEIKNHFPLRKKEVEMMLQELKNKILTIHDIEKSAVLNLQKIMSLSKER